MNEKESGADEQQQRKKFCDGDRRDRARTFAHTSDVDEHEHAVNREHDDDAHDRSAEKRNDKRDGIREYVDHACDRAEGGEKIKHACEKPDVFAERDFNVSIKSTG